MAATTAVGSGYFATGTSTDVDVCFAAETPSLAAASYQATVAEGSVDTLESGPTILEAAAAEALEIHATGRHPFYMPGRGWIAAEHLRPGDRCRTPHGQLLQLQSKEFSPTSEPVYNLEIQQAHTYFVGRDRRAAVLVHNDCPDCGAPWYDLGHDLPYQWWTRSM